MRYTPQLVNHNMHVTEKNMDDYNRTFLFRNRNTYFKVYIILSSVKKYILSSILFSYIIQFYISNNFFSYSLSRLYFTISSIYIFSKEMLHVIYIYIFGKPGSLGFNIWETASSFLYLAFQKNGSRDARFLLLPICIDVGSLAIPPRIL